jgi:DNA-binding PadR family transcriptional regulator
MARDKTDLTPAATPATFAPQAHKSGVEAEASLTTTEREKRGRSKVYRATPSGRLEAHEATISKMASDPDFTFDIDMYRAQVEYARAELDRENFSEARVHLADADAQLTRIGWILDEDRKLGAVQRKNLSGLREFRNKAAQAGASARRNLIASLLRETNLTGGALDKWIKKKLLQRHGITISERSIRNDRKALNS